MYSGYFPQSSQVRNSAPTGFTPHTGAISQARPFSQTAHPFGQQTTHSGYHATGDVDFTSLAQNRYRELSANWFNPYASHAAVHPQHQSAAPPPGVPRGFTTVQEVHSGIQSRQPPHPSFHYPPVIPFPTQTHHQFSDFSTPMHHPTPELPTQHYQFTTSAPQNFPQNPMVVDSHRHWGEISRHNPTTNFTPVTPETTFYQNIVPPTQSPPIANSDICPDSHPQEYPWASPVPTVVIPSPSPNPPSQPPPRVPFLGFQPVGPLRKQDILPQTARHRVAKQPHLSPTIVRPQVERRRSRRTRVVAVLRRFLTQLFSKILTDLKECQAITPLATLTTPPLSQTTEIVVETSQSPCCPPETQQRPTTPPVVKHFSQQPSSPPRQSDSPPVRERQPRCRRRLSEATEEYFSMGIRDPLRSSGVSFSITPESSRQPSPSVLTTPLTFRQQVEFVNTPSTSQGTPFFSAVTHPPRILRNPESAEGLLGLAPSSPQQLTSGSSGDSPPKEVRTDSPQLTHETTIVPQLLINPRIQMNTAASLLVPTPRTLPVINFVQVPEPRPLPRVISVENLQNERSVDRSMWPVLPSGAESPPPTVSPVRAPTRPEIRRMCPVCGVEHSRPV